MDNNNKKTELEEATDALWMFCGSETAGEFASPYNTEAPDKASEWLQQWVPEPLKCECGTDAIGAGRHSTWCPKYEKESL